MPTPPNRDALRFEIMVFADTHASAGDPGALHPVDKTTFAQVLKDLRPTVRCEVPDHLTAGRQPLRLNLAFSTMDDFRPLALLEQNDTTRPCLAVCRVLGAVARGELPTTEARGRLDVTGATGPLREQLDQVFAATPAAPPPTAAAPATEPSGDVLASVGLPDESPPSVRQSVDALVESLNIPKVEIAKSPQRRAAAALLADLCQRLHRQLDAILHHPEFAAVEGTWRGLQLLVSRVDPTATPVVIHLAHTERSALAERLRTALSARDAAPNGDGTDAVLLDFSFAPSAEDIQTLAALAEICDEHYCPGLAAAGPAFLGLDEASDFSTLPASFRAHFDGPTFIDFRGLRERDEAQSIALTVPLVVARPPYGPKHVPVPDIAYQESAAPTWLRGIWAVGASMVQGVARDGWCIAFSGATDGVVDSMPLAPVRARGDATPLTTQTVWTDEQVTELARAGLLTLQSRRGQNKILVLSVPTLALPAAASDPEERRAAALHATLPYRLFACRIARRLDAARGGIAPETPDRQVEAHLLTALGALFEKPGSVRVEASESEERPGTREVFVQILPDFRILGRDVDLILGFAL